jgi:hypothetical protein
MLLTKISFGTCLRICAGRVVPCICCCLQRHCKLVILLSLMTLNASRNVGQREETMSHLAEATSSHTLDCFSSGNIVFEFDCEIIASLPYRRAQASITQFKHNAAAELPLIDCTASTAQLVNYDKTIQRFQPKEADEAAPPEAEEGILAVRCTQWATSTSFL